jgi:PKD repeat protein
MSNLGITYAKYPTSGNASKTTDVMSNGDDALWWCWNCNEQGDRTHMGRYRDDQVINQIRRKAKAHADACDI